MDGRTTRKHIASASAYGGGGLKNEPGEQFATINKIKMKQTTQQKNTMSQNYIDERQCHV